MSINTMNQEQKMKNNTAKAANGAQTTGHQTTGAQTTAAQTIPAKKAFPSLAELLTPTRQPEAAPIIIAPRVDNIDITIVLGDQKNSHMSFYGGEASVDDPYGWNDENDAGERTDDQHGAAADETRDAVGEGLQDACSACEFTDCLSHPKAREGSSQPMEGSSQPMEGSPHPKEAERETDVSRHSSRMKVTEGDAALEGLPDYFKSFIKLLRHAGLDVEVKRYEQKDAREGKGKNDG